LVAALPAAGLLGAALARAAAAQGGAHAAVLLELPASTRALAVGGAAAALLDDDEALFYNPAQLAAVAHLSVGLSVQPYLANSVLGAASGAMRLGPGALALGVQTLEYGSADEVTPDPLSGETGVATGNRISASDLVASAGYALELRHVRVGGALKRVRQRVADVSGGVTAADLGAAVALGGWGTVGVAVQNLGGRLQLGGTGAPLPRLVRVGAALPTWRAGIVDVRTAVDAVQVRDGRLVPCGGADVTWRAPSGGLALAARAGVRGRGSSGEDVSPFSFGGGLAKGHVALDYAYESFRTIGGASHRVGLRWWR
jgi:hypothetical protein